MHIAKMRGYECFNSRGWPTVGCEITLEDGTRVHASVPSGQSTGQYEARELRDGGSRLWGRGVRAVSEYIDHIIAPHFEGSVPDGVAADTHLIDIDATVDKSHLGANIMLAASIAMYRAQAAMLGIPEYELIAYACEYDYATLPSPLFNVINGGAHARNQLSIQEFMILPVEVTAFRDALEVGVTIYHMLSQQLQAHGKDICVGDEGGFASQFADDEEALAIVYETITRAKHEHDISCVMALDVAASQLYDASRNRYVIQKQAYHHDAMIRWYHKLTYEYPIVFLEDPLAEDDEDGWSKLYHELDVHVVGDDLCATSPYRIAHAAERNWMTAAIIKPNQIGTVTEALQSMQTCFDHEIVAIASHRSGDTEDPFIADLAVGGHAHFIKAGAPARGERTAKYNRLMRIEDHLHGV